MSAIPSCYSLMSNDHLIMSAIQRGEHTPLEAELLARLEKATDALADAHADLRRILDYGVK